MKGIKEDTKGEDELQLKEMEKYMTNLYPNPTIPTAKEGNSMLNYGFSYNS